MSVRPAPQTRVELDGERAVQRKDELALAELLFEAYLGTVDQEEESPAEALVEIRKTLDGVYGDFLPAYSRLVEREGRPVSALLVTRYRNSPFLAFAFTSPAWKRQGLARACLINTLHDLFQAGEESLDLAVTRANIPAVQLYASLGFTRVP